MVLCGTLNVAAEDDASPLVEGSPCMAAYTTVSCIDLEEDGDELDPDTLGCGCVSFGKQS